MKKFLEDAQKLYDKGRWPESNQLIIENFDRLTTAEEIAEAYRLRGWNYYYIGTKGPKGLDNKQANLEKSRTAFQSVLIKTSDRKKKISIMNGLPLTYWVLGDQAWAWEVSDRAINEFPDEPSVRNTRAILCRWAKDFKQSVEVCEKVYETALARRDFRTAGHGKQNRGDALKELGRIEEARNDYAAAIGLYKDFEKTGESAKFHIEGVEKKLSAL